jgi:hypothetical protein
VRVYISGAISGRPLDEARDEFKGAQVALWDAGHEVVNPFYVAPHRSCACPSARGDDGAGSGHNWGCYLRGDLAALLDCDAICMLPGWEASHGARLELTVAAAVGLKVLWPEVAGWAGPWEVVPEEEINDGQ